jgi:alkyldihydroxyacetonephosphate synthase
MRPRSAFPMAAAGWGDPGQRPGVPERVRELLGAVYPLREAPPAPLRLPAAAPVPEALGAFGELRTDDEARARHTAGRSYLDLVRLRAGEPAAAPDAVVAPGSHEEVLGLLRACAEHGVAAVPFGGGTSVVGGVEPLRGGHGAVVALDLRRLDRVEVDPESMVAVLGAGLLAPQAEEALGEHGLTLGHVPQSFERASIGGFAATRSAGQASAGYGRFEDMVVGLRVATPEGELDLGRAPASAAGPDLRALLLGSEGAFGVITEVRVRVHRRPTAARYEGWRFASFAEGAAALRGLAQAGALPDVARLSDEAETALMHDAGEGCLLIAGVEGDGGTTMTRSSLLGVALRAAGGTPLGPEPGERWLEGRFRAPYLRDDLLDLGLLVETLETATSWTRLHALHAAVGDALRGALGDPPPVVLAHVSHVYATGASLYFTVVGARDAEDPVGQWTRAKAAALDAIAGAGATITHHHAVGTDHRAWMEREVGPLGVEVLRAVKARLDPRSVMNPGKLV